MRKLRTIADVIDWGLCVGCGACASACTHGGVTMTHVEKTGYRPVFREGCDECRDCIPVCPGARLTAPTTASSSSVSTEFGDCLEIHEGWATDPEVRRKGSSGGVLSALSLFCLERGGFDGILHAGMDPEQPWRNRNFVSRTREDVLSRTGSRYAPSSPCEGLSTPRPAGRYVFIGKPCDTAAASALIATSHDCVADVALTLTFFCAGTPSTRGTLSLIEGAGLTTQGIRRVQYRGEGWPGYFEVSNADGTVLHRLTYEDSWARLTEHRPLRCNLCPDGLGRLADISCGDAWHRFSTDDPGRSLILVRTERGRTILRAAAQAGYVTLGPATQRDVLAAQQNLLERRRALFGRLVALTLVGAPIPNFRGFSLLRGWMTLSVYERARSVVGTLRRALTRGWFRPGAHGDRSGRS